MSQQATRPDFFLSNMPSLVADQKAEEKGATEEERQLYSMARTKGWKIWREYLDNVLEDLDNMASVSIENGADFNVIGQNAVVVNATKAIINRMINRVDDAIEACERYEPEATK